jgi:hypothetical protein
MVQSKLINLDEIILTRTVNEFTTTLGIDSFAHCQDRDHYNSYTKFIVYKFNELGYRDEEWPENIDNCVWAIGDSFTVGIGQPFEETWPQLVQTKLQTRVINISMNGASATWIARRAKFIIDNFNPKTILIQWSYVHRREDPDASKLDEDRALPVDPLDVADFENLTANIMLVESIKLSTVVIHSFIPKFFDGENDLPKATVLYNMLDTSNILYFPPPDQADVARDGYHYDILTSTHYANSYVNLL